MKKKILATSLLATALAAVVPAAQATDLLFLKNSPASKFTAADFKLLRANLEKALAGPPDGPALEWKNDQTGASGSVTPVGVDEGAAPKKCRKLRVANAYKLMKDEGVYIFCMGNTGKWALKS
ncbi:MAG TPA: RT0821/Lpp0805 family surface protein [Variovorax sp.]|nr:RT0821/Lpp0805 family surface protein [Variovorax sp.]